MAAGRRARRIVLWAEGAGPARREERWATGLAVRRPNHDGRGRDKAPKGENLGLRRR